MTEGKSDDVDDSPLGAHFLIGTHNRSKKNIIECEIDGFIKNGRRIKIKLIAIEIVRKMSDDLGMIARKVGKDQEADEGILRGSWARAQNS
jgi:hypothetical protein